MPVDADGEAVRQPPALSTAPVGIISGLGSLGYVAFLLTGRMWTTSSLTYSFPDTLADWVRREDGTDGAYNVRPDGSGGVLPDTNEPRLPGFGPPTT